MARASHFPQLERRLREKFGGRVWLERSNLPGLPSDAQPWSFWGRDRVTGQRYKILECIGEDGSYREPGDWCLRELDWLRHETQWGNTRGAHNLVEQHFHEQERKRRRHWEKRRDDMIDSASDKLKHATGWRGVNVGHFADAG